MLTCKVSEAAAIAVDLGYTGDQADPVAVKNFLVEKNPTDVVGPDGAVVDFKTLTIEAATPPVKRKLNVVAGTRQTATSTIAAEGTTATPADLNQKIEAIVAQRLAAAGATKSYKPGMIVPKDAPIGVKSGEQREYEDRLANGKAFCTSYESAKGLHLWLQAKSARAYLDQGTYDSVNKQFGEWASHVTDGQKAYDTFTAASAGNTIPDLFQAELIRNVLDYGIYNQLSRVINMPGPQMNWSQRTGGVTGSYPAENVAPSVSTGTLNNISLNAKTFQVLQQASKQILTDSGIAMMEWIMQEAAMAIAKQKDDVLIIGNASGTYAGATGYEFKYGVTAADTGQSITGGGDATAHTAADLTRVIGRLPQNYRRNSPCWTCSPGMASIIFDRLAETTPGGLTWREHSTLGYVRYWRGFPIIENNCMSSVAVASTTNRTGFTAGDQIDVLFGDFSRAAFFGELQSMEVEVSAPGGAGMLTNSTYVAVRARFDTNIYNVGDSTNAGAVVALWQT